MLRPKGNNNYNLDQRVVWMLAVWDTIQGKEKKMIIMIITLLDQRITTQTAVWCLHSKELMMGNIKQDKVGNRYPNPSNNNSSNLGNNNST